MCIFIYDKNADALLLHMLMGLCERFCLATIWADVFFVRQLRLAHFLIWRTL
jgi:hypothetical protein